MHPRQSRLRSANVMDLFALGASATCMAHCLLLPMLLVLMPAASHLLDAPESFHLWAFALAVPASALAMRAGYRHHGNLHPMLMAGLGLALLAVGALAGLRLVAETGFTVAGSVLLAGAHARNWRLRRIGRAVDQ